LVGSGKNPGNNHYNYLVSTVFTNNGQPCRIH
jgi:hypothetical protein